MSEGTNPGRGIEGESAGGVPTAPGGGRRFGDAEIARILRTAVELQERSGALAADGARGLTLDELRQVAREAGIDPRFVDLALVDAGGPVGRYGGRLVGAAHTWRFHLEIPGEIGDEDRNRILRQLRAQIGKKGEVAEVFGRMEWSADDGLGPIIVGVTSGEGNTEVDLAVARSGEASLYYGLGMPMGGIFGGAGLAGLFGLSGPAVLPFIAVAAAASYGVVRLGWRARSAWWERRLRRMVDQLQSMVQEVARPGPAAEGE